MPPPYTPGQKLVWLDSVPGGVLVQRAVVRAIEPAGDGANGGLWRVSTDRGSALVDDTGNAGRIIPLDADMEYEFSLHGGSDFVVPPTPIDLDLEIERLWGRAGSQEHDQDHSLELGDDLGFD